MTNTLYTPTEAAVAIMEGDGRRDEVISVLVEEYGLTREEADAVHTAAVEKVYGKRRAERSPITDLLMSLENGDYAVAKWQV